jgi:amidase
MTAAGAVLYGKTNVPLDLSDWQSFNDVYGTTNNPWKLSRTPGGSSGGAAVALATGMSAMEIGSDIGASIRNPAHYCGVFGHKPTYELVSYKGHGLPGSVSLADITVAGPLARSAKDLGVMLNIMAGPSSPASRAVKVALPRPEQKSLKDFRVAVKLNSAVADVDHLVQDKISKLAETLQKRVAKLSMTAAPAFSDEENYQIFITLLRATAAKKLSDVQYLDAVAQAKQLSNTDRSYVAMMTRAFALSHRDWLRIHDRRNQMRLIWDQFFDEWDVLLCPVATSTAFVQNHVGERHERYITVNGKQQSMIDQRFWAGYSGGYYLPSTVAPLGLASDGLPVGVQIITREFDDLKAIRFAELMEKEFGGFKPPPGY